MTITEAVALRLNDILKRRGMTKKQFEELDGVKGQSICNIFRTRSTTGISMTTLYRICRALGMTMSEFLNSNIFERITLD